MAGFNRPLTVALGGAIVGIISSWIVTIINRRFDDRRHMRQIAIETALQNWKQDFEIAKLISEKTNRPVSFSPLDAYIIHMFQLAELMSNKRLTAENINSELTRIRAVTAAVTKTTKE